MTVFFAGTPEIAVNTLEAIAGRFEVCGVLTNPDRPSGRNSALKPSPVKETAQKLGLAVFQPEKIDSSFIGQVKALSPDVLVTFAYGKIFRAEFLSLFEKETVNIHPSLLPRHRGPSPISAAILAGDKETGITFQRMALKMDSGDIIRQIKFQLSGSETLESLSMYVSRESALVITEVLADIESGNYSPIPQDEKHSTYCRLVTREDGLIDWKRKTSEIERSCRAYRPWPGIYTYWNGRLLAITECHMPEKHFDDMADIYTPPGTVAGVDRDEGILIKTGDSLLAVTGLKLQSKNEMNFKSFLNGARDFTGSLLTGPPGSGA